MQPAAAMQLLADRFLWRDGRWFDTATARPVAVRVQPAGAIGAQIAWAEQCAMHAALRHPYLNPLVDYGAAGARLLFEAYAAGDEVPRRLPPETSAVRQARRFLEGHGVFLSRDVARLALRARCAGACAADRAVGHVLQTRGAEAIVADVFATPQAGGVSEVRIAGPPGSGVRTLTMAAARHARAAGYVPVCPAALVLWPDLMELLSARHVCVLTSDRPVVRERTALAILWIRLGLASARSHLCLVVQRTFDQRAGATVHLEAMGAVQMASMVYVDPDAGPAAADLLDAARRARGNPGHFVAHLTGGEYGTESVLPPACVHETPAAYVAEAPDVSCGSRLRLDAAARRARGRARALRRRGRHAAAARLLTRAARVLQARGDKREASQCLIDLAWMRRGRGATADAADLAARARETDPSPAGQLAAAHVQAICWVDDGRFIEAEAALRSLAAAASTLGSSPEHQQCVLALARALHWQGRHHEVLATLEPLLTAADPAITSEALWRSARAHLRIGDVPRAVRRAREALARAAESHDPRVHAASHAAMGEALLAAGDAQAACDAMRMGIKAASLARLPLLSLRIQALLGVAMADAGAAGGERQRVYSRLERARRGRVPVLLRRAIEGALAAREGRGAALERLDDMTRVERFLDVAQRAQDDSAAVTDVLAALCQSIGALSAALVSRDGRVVAAAGRAFRDSPRAAAQALASGAAVGADGVARGAAAEPVRCGGEILAAVECRWSPTSSVIAQVRAPAMRAAAMAMATHVRGLLEAVPPAPPAAVWGDLLGESRGAVTLREAIARASRAPFPVLIEGESGSGKELVARAIHRLSPRHARRFCAINCAALSDELVEAELFGHTRGAFTCAATERAGLFEEADGGTLFLDEVGELSGRAQAKLLRVLQEGEVRRVGENLARRVDVRIVAATNRRLEEETVKGRFRLDLRFRLDVLRITVPPLRERIEDIPVLAQHFWTQACERVGSRASLGADAVAALSRYDWPGNVRELQNAIAWIAVHAPRRGRVGANALPAQLAASPLATGSFEAAREEFERRYVRAALAQAGGHRQLAARALGISRQGLAKMLRRLRIEPQEETGRARAGP